MSPAFGRMADGRADASRAQAAMSGNVSDSASAYRRDGARPWERMEAAMIALREQERAVLEALQMERDDARAKKDSVHHAIQINEAQCGDAAGRVKERGHRSGPRIR